MKVTLGTNTSHYIYTCVCLFFIPIKMLENGKGSFKTNVEEEVSNKLHNDAKFESFPLSLFTASTIQPTRSSSSACHDCKRCRMKESVN